MLARNPQDLVLLAEIIRALGAKNMPARRAELYREILMQDTALADWARANSAEIRAICNLAFQMVREQRVLGEGQLGEWVSRAIEQDTGTPAQANTVTAIVEALKRSRLFVEEEERDVLGRTRPVIGFRHELIGKFLAARHLRLQLSHGSEAERARMLELSGEETWLDVFCFAIDEIDTQEDIARLIEDLIGRGDSISMRAAAYALGTKPVAMVPEGCRAAYGAARLELDLELTPAA